MEFKIKKKRLVNVFVVPKDINKSQREPKKDEIEIIQEAVNGIDLQRFKNTKTILCQEFDIIEEKAKNAK